jgi:hypothetical protein
MALVGQISIHCPQYVQTPLISSKFTRRLSPILVGGEKKRFSGHISTQSLHLIH